MITSDEKLMSHDGTRYVENITISLNKCLRI